MRGETVQALPLGLFFRVLRWWCLAVLLGSAVAPRAAAQEPDTLASLRSAAPRVFLDCNACDFTYIRREVPYVNYVRNRSQAQVHVLVTTRGTGGGGTEYAFDFIGLETDNDLRFELTYTSLPTDTDDAERRGVAHTLKMGLVPYVARTPLAGRITIDYDEPEDARPLTQVNDPWNAWVFDLDLGAAFDAEEQRSSRSVYGSFSADRVTETWRVRNEVELDYDMDEFEQEDETIRSSATEIEADASVVRSLSTHWSAGAFASGYSNSTINTDLGVRLRPALEYNIFPYRESARRELTIAYTLGVRHVDYHNETIFGKLEETLFEQALQAQLRVTQPWGSAYAYLIGFHYFHDPGKYRVEFDGRISLRLYKGLAVSVRGGVEAVHDQLYLEKGDASLEDILLQRKRLATTYEYYLSVGLSFTFGSIYNNIVNTRL